MRAACRLPGESDWNSRGPWPREPKMLLLDEVMGGLRPTEINEMINLVRKIREQGVSLLLVEHVMKVIMSLADRIVVDPPWREDRRRRS